MRPARTVTSCSTMPPNSSVERSAKSAVNRRRTRTGHRPWRNCSCAIRTSARRRWLGWNESNSRRSRRPPADLKGQRASLCEARANLVGVRNACISRRTSSLRWCTCRQASAQSDPNRLLAIARRHSRSITSAVVVRTCGRRDVRGAGGPWYRHAIAVPLHLPRSGQRNQESSSGAQQHWSIDRLFSDQ